MPLRKYNPSSTHAERAVQAWTILIGAAMSRQTLTYLGLSQLMYRRNAAGVLNEILGHIAFYCRENKLPALTSIVVGNKRGTPGKNIPVDHSQLDKIREKVYAYDWFNIALPSVEELRTCFTRNAK